MAPFVRIALVAFAMVLATVGLGSTAQAAVVTVSGTAMFDEAGHPWSECNGVTANVSLSVNGAAKQSVPCSRVTGAFSMSVNLATPDVPLALFLDPTTPGSRGMVVTRNADATSAITGMSIVQDRVVVRSESATSPSDAAFAYTSANDSDVPVTKTGCSLTLASGSAFVVDAGESYSMAGCAITAWGLVVRSAGTFDGGWSQLALNGSGNDADCTLGVGVSRPLCIAPGGTFIASTSRVVFAPADGGDLDIPALTYWDVNLRGNVLNTTGRIPRATLGTASGQTVTFEGLSTGAACGSGCPEQVILDSAPWAPNIVANGIDIGRNSRWEGSTLPFTIQARIYFLGSGAIHLPSADLTLDATEASIGFGPGGWGWENGVDWTLRSVTFTSSYWRSPFGAGAGVTSAWNSGVGQVDTAAGVSLLGDRVLLLGTQNTGSAARGFVTQWWSINGNTVPTDCGAQPQTAVWNSGLSADTALGTGEAGGSVYQWGTNAANGTDGTIRKLTGTCGYDDSFGTNDSPDVGAGNDFIRLDYDNNASGYDEPRFVTAESGFVDVIGTVTNAAGSNTRDFGAVRFNATGSVPGVPQKLIWNSAAGAADDVAGGCYDSTLGIVYVIGTIPSGGGDIAIRSIDTATWTWRPWFGNADLDASVAGNDTFVYNSGGVNPDAGVACTVWFGGAMSFTGSANVGGNTSTIVGMLQDWRSGTNGQLDTTFGTAGIATFDMGAGITETPRALAWDDAGLIVAGRASSNAGDEFLARFDPDGDLDTTFWTGGSEPGGPNGDGVLVPSTAATDSSAAGLAVGWGGTLYVARTDGSTNNGDIAVEAFDGAGDARATSSAGRSRIVSASGHNGDSTSLHVARDVRVGAATGSNVLLDLESFDLLLDVGNAINVGVTGWLRASSSVPLRVHNDFIATSGRFTANRGTIDVSGGEFRSEIRPPAVSGVHNSFYGLRIASLPGVGQGQKIAAFSTINPTRVTNNLVLDGSDCTGRINVTSISPGTPATIDSTGATRTLRYLNVTDTTLSPAGTFTDVNLLGGTTGITASAPCAAASVTSPNGFYSDDTNAQNVSGLHNSFISSQAPHFSWFNRSPNSTKEQVRVYSDLVNGEVPGLWRLDGNGTNLGSGSTPLTLDASPNTPAWTAAGGGRFGQGLDFTANQRATIASSTAYDTRTFTVDTWFRTASIANVAYPSLVSRHGTNEQFEVGFDRAAGILYGEVQVGGTDYKVSYPASRVVDGAWHHVALTNRQTTANTAKLTLFVDGVELEGERYLGQSGIATGQPIYVGNSVPKDQPFNGQVDEIRFVNRALGADEILGWYRTGRRHGDLIWDSSPSNLGNNFPGNVTLGLGARTPDIVYAGAAGSLVLDGARYYTQARFADAGGTFSSWNPGDWFETRASLTLANAGASTVPLGTVLPGEDAYGSASFQVSTSAARGYTLQTTTIVDGRGPWSGTVAIPTWAGTPGTPSSWSAGSPGFGVTTLSATPGKDTARWGTGTTATDIANLKYAGPSHTTPTSLFSRTSYSAATDTVVMGIRANAPANTKPGFYSTTLTVTAFANP